MVGGLGVREFGVPGGMPVLFVHGYASSGWAAGWTLCGEVLRREGVRVIAVDRPGYGGTPPGAPWLELVAALVEPVGPVVVAGVSMGASAALGLAVARPDLVAGVAVLSGMAPAPAGKWAPASREDAFYWRLARSAPWLLRRLCAVSAGAMSKGARGDAAKLMARVERALPAADLEVFRERMGTGRAAFLADVAESSRQGGAAMADDLVRHLRPWAADPAAVKVPVRLLHGVEDPKVPVKLARSLADRLPDVRAAYLPGGHFAPFADQEALVGTLLDLGRAKS
ncbi:alpha/beta fold hydrolase [Nonomuraea typhae]|uniref:alpha/beta fold hydrolase n=1 Tax=Nonomuraea typhae TaxID=2603600 RepID=UPI0012FBD222|nr:alpha/beta hydrolase [Nonomuraea typhae]